MKRAILFDLDETLVVDEAAAVASFLAAARTVPEGKLDHSALALMARAHARTLWRSAPSWPYCQQIGISSWEGLWARFEAEGRDTRALREWAPTYRHETWRLALRDQGVDDDALAEDLGDRFGVERRARHETYADAAPLLDQLQDKFALAVVTNGLSCLQREKLNASGLAGRFGAVVASGDRGFGKPDPSIFKDALDALGASAEGAVMVGDSIKADIGGALATGLTPIWINRLGQPRPAGYAALAEIRTLSDLPGLLDAP